MDPLSAIGLASSVVQFIDFGLKVASRLHEFSSSNPSDLPKSLLSISTQLPLLLSSLQRITTSSKLSSLDFDTKCILRGVVSGCQTQVEEVEKILNDISKIPGDSLKHKLKKVFTSMKYDERVGNAERNLHTYISVLILHHVIDSSEAFVLPSDDAFWDVREKRLGDGFVEREKLVGELEGALYEVARGRKKEPTIVHVTGEKGVGKTQLVLEFTHLVHGLGQFKTVFWIDASSYEDLCLGFESIYATVRRSRDGSRTEKIKFVKEFLEKLWHPWLLILDNYDSDILYNSIMEFLPSQGYGGIVLISREGSKQGLGQTIFVPKFLAQKDQNNLNRLLQNEVQNKNPEAIRGLVEQGADVDTMIWNEWPILHRAALFGLEDVVTFLLEQGANPNPATNCRKPIIWAAGEGHEGVCRLLLDHEDAVGPITTQADNEAAFHAAAEAGSLSVVKMLFERRGVALNTNNQLSNRPVSDAARKGHVDVLDFLLDHGALQEEHKQGEDALVSAASNGHFDVVKLLCTKGKVNPGACDGSRRSVLCYAVALKDKENRESAEAVEMTSFLLKKGADPNPMSERHEGPLHQASLYEHLGSLKLLLERGADPMKDAGGWDPLTSAIKYHSPQSISMLLAAKVKEEDQTKRKAWLEGALRYAARQGDRASLLQLLDAGADVNAVSQEGFPKNATALLLSILYDHVKAAQFLIRKGANQNIKDEKGRLPLHLAAEKGFEFVVRDLLKKGGDVDARCGEDEETPLMGAAREGKELVIKCLVEAGADLDAMNRFGDTALDIAEEKGWKKEVRELLGG
ncbi:hypothetical protein G7Y89_g7532 [Cudoniella acicularis]|uniref:NACHT-NTPase and P-loop NTPases N-terminal domain-containing protein n=1 Tax=Cudoniella acicularis TaxID=354080 RepID=A0A8H4RID1_9HELO|nr:hypothetical protein G7Y89_g7532 [Cudoniella acicularis]